MVQDRGIADRSFIVTGGSAGIGEACAARLLADGARVTICGRSRRHLDDARQRLIESDVSAVDRLRCEVADVTIEADVVRLVTRTIAEFGALHGVVANAGGGGTLEPYHRRDVAEFVRVLNLNLLSTMLCVKHAAPALAAAGGGSFVAMSSLASSLTHPYFGAYPIAKVGIEALVRNAADEYGAVNVRFNAVAPGFVDTEAMAVIPRDSAVFRSYVDNTPLGRIGRAEEVAGLVRFLLGPEGCWITGETIRIDGGNHLRRGPDYGSLVALDLPSPDP